MTSETGNPVSEDELHALVDRRLDVDRAAQVRAYLDADGKLANEVENWRTNDAALSEILSAYAYGEASDIPAPTRAGSSRFGGWPAMAGHGRSRPTGQPWAVLKGPTDVKERVESRRISGCSGSGLWLR